MHLHVAPVGVLIQFSVWGLQKLTVAQKSVPRKYQVTVNIRCKWVSSWWYFYFVNNQIFTARARTRWPWGSWRSRRSWRSLCPWNKTNISESVEVETICKGTVYEIGEIGIKLFPWKKTQPVLPGIPGGPCGPGTDPPVPPPTWNKFD